eukprot:3736049-Rhodomonas_salina.3
MRSLEPVSARCTSIARRRRNIRFALDRACRRPSLSGNRRSSSRCLGRALGTLCDSVLKNEGGIECHTGSPPALPTPGRRIILGEGSQDIPRTLERSRSTRAPLSSVRECDSVNTRSLNEHRNARWKTRETHVLRLGVYL